MNETDSSDDDGFSMNRRDVLRVWTGAAAFGATGMTLPQQAEATESYTRAEADEIWTEVLSRLPDNWGRWGADDELGTFNYLDGREAFRGMRAAMQGDKDDIEVFSLQTSITGDLGKDPTFPGRRTARRDQVQDARHYQEGVAEPLPGGIKFTDDAFVTRTYLQGLTQHDALAHIWYDTRKRPGEDGLADEKTPLLYNGFDADTTATPREFDEAIDGLRPAGDPENDLQDVPEDYDPFSQDLVEVDVDRTWEVGRASVEPAAENGIVGRGVLLDVGRNSRLPSDENDRLEPGTCIGLEDLRETADEQGVDLEPHDIPLVRTGSIERARDPDATWSPNVPGLCFSQELIEWLHEMEFPLVAADNLSVERLGVTIDPEEALDDDLIAAVEDETGLTVDDPIPVFSGIHPAALTNLGLPLHEVYYLEELAESVADGGPSEFLFSGSPLNVVGGAGGPINPVAVVGSGRGNGDD
jgi:kynurenine formamidase